MTDRRAQFTDNLSSLSALITALADLDALCATIEDAYVTDMHKGEYELWDERS
jgi:DNA-directed RNA polymerase I and III subunit RPAC2